MTKDNEGRKKEAKHATIARSIRDRTIAFFDGRPAREEPIGNEEINDLLIALNTCTSLEEFLCSV
ncbi:MAG: hypothetical protein GF344_07410 [Chitinivibrionales bacterium]|nr:hypothetical protein [Chitinivibrionales bacterium]MBD3356735.1 hypothetical protein [Chitinivibrionales bacterium]